MRWPTTIAATLMEMKMDYEHAIADFSESIKLDPRNAEVFNARCWARAIAGRDLQQALADCGESLRLRPNDANTHGRFSSLITAACLELYSGLRVLGHDAPASRPSPTERQQSHPAGQDWCHLGFRAAKSPPRL